MCKFNNNNKYSNQKVIYVNFPDHIIYYLVKLFQYDRQIFFKNVISSKYLSISFAFDYKFKHKFTEIIKYLKDNNIQHYYYSIDSVKSLQIFAGYNNILFYDLFEYYFLFTKFESSYNKFTYLLKFLANLNALVHICISDIVFNPAYSICYTADDMANSKMEYRLVQYQCYLANTIHFMHTYFKLPVYKFIIPFTFQHEVLLEFQHNSENVIKKPDSTNMQFELRKEFEKLILPKRCVMSNQDFAKAMYLFMSKGFEAKNYAISSDNLSTSYWANLASLVNKNDNRPSIKVDWQELKSLGYIPSSDDKTVSLKPTTKGHAKDLKGQVIGSENRKRANHKVNLKNMEKRNDKKK